MEVTKSGTHFASLDNLTKISGSFDLSSSGDNIFIYQGDKDDPIFIFGFASKQWVHIYIYIYVKAHMYICMNVHIYIYIYI